MVDDELEGAFDRHEAHLGALAGDLEPALAFPAVNRAEVQAQQF